MSYEKLREFNSKIKKNSAFFAENRKYFLGGNSSKEKKKKWKCVLMKI